MFTLLSEFQFIEVFGQQFDGADVLKDENNDIFMACTIDFPDGMGYCQKVFIVYVGLLPIFASKKVDFNTMKETAWKTFETRADYCKWCSYNLAS